VRVHLVDSLDRAPHHASDASTGMTARAGVLVNRKACLQLDDDLSKSIDPTLQIVHGSWLPKSLRPQPHHTPGCTKVAVRHTERAATVPDLKTTEPGHHHRVRRPLGANDGNADSRPRPLMSNTPDRAPIPTPAWPAPRRIGHCVWIIATRFGELSRFAPREPDASPAGQIGNSELLTTSSLGPGRVDAAGVAVPSC
jgi:hypothetical protein